MNDIKQRHSVTLPTLSRRVHVIGTAIESEPAYGLIEPTASSPATQLFAIPTTCAGAPVGIGDLRWYVGEFLTDARDNAHLTFVVHANTFAEIAPDDVIAEMFANAPDNVELPAGWVRDTANRGDEVHGLIFSQAVSA